MNKKLKLGPFDFVVKGLNDKIIFNSKVYGLDCFNKEAKIIDIYELKRGETLVTLEFEHVTFSVPESFLIRNLMRRWA